MNTFMSLRGLDEWFHDLGRKKQIRRKIKEEKKLFLKFLVLRSFGPDWIKQPNNQASPTLSPFFL